MKRIFLSVLSVALIVMYVSEVSARGGDRGNGRSHARTSVNSGHQADRNRNVNRGGRTNVNRNVNVNRDVNVNNRGYNNGCCYHDDDDHNVVAAVAVVAATAIVVGSIVNSVPPSCQTVDVDGYAYQKCGDTWYQPQISGSSTTYIVVNAP